MNITRKLVIFIIFGAILHQNHAQPKEFRRFWTNTGFAPIGDDPQAVLLSPDTLTNIEFISSLPNHALNTIRIHWLLDLIGPETDNYQKLDAFLDFLVKNGMNLCLEFMSHHQFDWELVAYSILKRYSKRYGLHITSQWVLETWNEPDLASYNVLNFTLNDYLNYIQALKSGINRISHELGHQFTLRGPAGLFRSPENHEFCWKALELCENGGPGCPFDVISFHRKGNGTAESVFSETISLVIELSNKFPRLSQMKFSNDEADPIVTWSTPRPFQADFKYAATIVETILFHWTAIYNEIVNLDSISHDNAFLSFYPHQWTQRTLLARFQMNNTLPPHTQFFEKPVFVALGLMGNMGPLAFDLQQRMNANGSDVTYVTTIGRGPQFYLSSILVVKNVTNDSFNYQIPEVLHVKASNRTIWYAVEGLLDDAMTDPYDYWMKNGSPSYPNAAMRDVLRKLQGPVLLQHGKNDIFRGINVKLRSQAILLIRACEANTIFEPKIYQLQVEKVTKDEVLLFWHEIPHEERSILTYQVYFKTIGGDSWTEITKNRHVPFGNFQFRAKNATFGCYKVRSIDITMQKGGFSPVACISSD